MTAYELFERVYKHKTGQFLGRIMHTDDTPDTLKGYIRQSFDNIMGQYCIEYAGNDGLMLSFGEDSDDTSPAVDVDVLLADKELCNTQRLQNIEVYEGYWFCHYDGHTGDWDLSHYVFKDEAVARRNEWRGFGLKGVDWYWIVKVGYEGLEI